MEKEKPGLDQVKKWADRLLAATHKMVVGPNTYKAPLFPRIVEAAYRRDYLTLYTVRHLSEGRPEEAVAFGNSSMALARRLIEDLVSLEYMKLEGKDKMSEKFANYRHVQDKLDFDYYKAAGIAHHTEIEQLILEGFEKVRGQFLEKSSKSKWKAWEELTDFLISEGCNIDKQKIENEFNKRYPSAETKIRRNWAGLDVEQMMIMLFRADKTSDDSEKSTLMQVYMVGNSKIHFSPNDLLGFLYNELYEASGKADMSLSLLVITMSLIKIAHIFTEEFDVPELTVKELNAIWNDLLNVHKTGVGQSQESSLREDGAYI